MILQLEPPPLILHLASPVDGVTVCGLDAERLLTMVRYRQLPAGRRWCAHCERMRAR